MPPSITITSPANGSSIIVGSLTAISANALDRDGTITSVNFLIDGVSKYSDASIPYNYEWNTTDYEAGNHTLKVIATDNEGASNSAEIIVSLGNLPVADFSANKTNDTVPLTIVFTDLSNNNPTSWSWSFGDGGTSTSQNPSHTYNSAGTYTVSLTVTNAYGSDTETKTNYITVSPGGTPPTGYFTDSRDGQGYAYIEIGTQTWMAENLAYLPSVSPSSAGSTTSPIMYMITMVQV